METPSEGAAVEGSCGKRGAVASELRAETRFCARVGLPDSHRYRGEGMQKRVPGERAQARNLGGTAKRPFALKQGEGLFFKAAGTHSVSFKGEEKR